MDDEIEREERTIYIIILVALAPVVLSLGYRGVRAIDGGTALTLLIAVCGAIGLVAVVRRMQTKLPTARVHRR